MHQNQVKFLLLSTLTSLITAQHCARPTSPNETVYASDPIDCSKFHVCVHGRPQNMTCPPGLLWNQALKACDWECDKSDITATTEIPLDLPVTQSTDPGNLCSTPRNGSIQLVFTLRGDCSKFVWCLNNQPIVMICPKGTFWNHTNQRCSTLCEVSIPEFPGAQPQATSLML